MPAGNPITTKNGIPGSPCTLIRSAGSKAGVTQLIAERIAAAAPNPVRRPCVDFARSINNSADPAFAGSNLTWVPFAVDALGIVTRADSLLATTFTPGQLRSIYECTLPPLVQDRFRPLLPPEGTETRENFLTLIGLPGPPAVPGSCVSDRDPTDTVAPFDPLREHVGNVLTDPRHLVPHSIAQHNAQTSGAFIDNTGTTKIGRISGVLPNVADREFRLRFPLFNVVPTQLVVGAGANVDYVQVFVGGNSRICSNPNVILGNGLGLLNNPDDLLPRRPAVPVDNTGCGGTISIKTGGQGVDTGPPSP